MISSQYGRHFAPIRSLGRMTNQKKRTPRTPIIANIGTSFVVWVKPLINRYYPAVGWILVRVYRTTVYRCGIINLFAENRYRLEWRLINSSHQTRSVFVNLSCQTKNYKVLNHQAAIALTCCHHSLLLTIRVIKVTRMMVYGVFCRSSSVGRASDL